MTIRSITIGSYKSFLTSVTIPLSPHFNVFIGPNNCGKTNVLDAIDFLAHPEKDPTRLHHHRTQLRMMVELNRAEQERFRMEGPIEVAGRKYEVRVEAQEGRIGTAVRSYIASQVKMLRYDDFEDFAQIEKDYSTFAEHYPKEYALLMKLLREYFPEVGTIQAIVDEKADDFGTVSVGSTSITISRLGGGFRRVLVILLYALHPEYSVVLIDEPEIHLHPGMIKKLLRLLASDIIHQVIVTSHSPLFITAGTLHQIYRVLKDTEGSHVYSLMQNPQRIDRQRLVQELNADNLEMFFADKVLLVEGVSDRILMRGLIDRFYKGPLDIKVIYTHGKSNIDIYMELMHVFNIPYLVMLDRDALASLIDQLHLHHHLRGYSGTDRERLLLAKLRERNILILENGTIENNYPRRYQIKDSKPLNALYAAANITPQEYLSAQMKNLKLVIEEL